MKEVPGFKLLGLKKFFHIHNWYSKPRGAGAMNCQAQRCQASALAQIKHWFTLNNEFQSVLHRWKIFANELFQPNEQMRWVTCLSDYCPNSVISVVLDGYLTKKWYLYAVLLLWWYFDGHILCIHTHTQGYAELHPPCLHFSSHFLLWPLL